MIILLLLLGYWWKNDTRGNNDFKMVFLSEKGILMRSVSWERKMVNEMEIEGDVSVWVPKGMGWYQSNKIGRLLTQENKTEIAAKVVFYNFGFVPDVVIYGEGEEDWLSNWEILRSWGLKNVAKYWYLRSRMMIKKETIKGDLLDQADNMGEIVQRDLADSRLLKEDLRITVYNQGQSSGLAGFVARALEWSGLTVVGVDNYDGKVEGDCWINFGSQIKGTIGLKIIKSEFDECRLSEDEKLNSNEVELYLSDGYSQMLNYASYK